LGAFPVIFGAFARLARGYFGPGRVGFVRLSKIGLKGATMVF
jgi:hypothetical protein